MSSLYDIGLIIFNNFGYLAYLGITAVTFFESVVFLGALFPGTLFIFTLGFLASHDVLHVSYLILYAVIGGVLGDICSYYMGVRGVKFFSLDSKILNQKYIDKGQEYFFRHGGKSILISKFIGFFRGIVPFVAGLSAMQMNRFLPWSLSGNLISISLYTLSGFFFGEFIIYFNIWSKRIGAGLAIVLVGVFIVWFMRTKRNEIDTMKIFLTQNFRGYVMGNRIMNLITHSIIFRIIGRRFELGKFSGMFGTAIFSLFLFSLFLLSPLLDKLIDSRAVLLFDRSAENFFLWMRNDILTTILRWFTLFFDMAPFVGVVIFVFSILYLLEERLYAWLFAVSIAVTSGSVYLLKFFSDRGRPFAEPLFGAHQSSSFPSGHTAMATLFVGYLLFILFKKKIVRTGYVSVFLASSLVLTVAISRIYLGLHFATDVIAGFILGLLLCLLTISVTEIIQVKFKFIKRDEYSTTLLKKGLIASMAIVVILGFFYYGNNKIRESNEYINGIEFDNAPRFLENN